MPKVREPAAGWPSGNLQGWFRRARMALDYSPGGIFMFRPMIVAVTIFVIWVGTVSAFEVQAVLKKIEVENRAVVVFVGGQNRTVKVAKDAKVLDEKGKELADGLKDKSLKTGVEVTLTVERVGNEPMITAIQLGKKAGSSPPQGAGKSSVGFKPLTEMTPQDKYQEEDGGSYGGGENEPPKLHQAAAKKETAKIVPLDAAGRPAPSGQIVLISISMSNATQEFSRFKQFADADPRKSPLVTIVDCAQGGQAMAQWSDPQARAWAESERRIASANVTPKQVQVAWIKLANPGPSGKLSEHGKKLQRDTVAVLQIAKTRFPNLRIAYLGSRIYGGYATTRLNPEPYAYETAFVVRWLIQDQMKGASSLNYDPAHGAAKSPLLLWGPYFWADGLTARKSDHLVWERADFGGDGTHPSDRGRQKVADMLLDFFTTDANTKIWFARSSE
jgi:hypothetical protein